MKNTAAGSAVIPEKIRNRKLQVSEMFEELNDTIKQILEESERQKEIAASSFFRMYAVLEELAENPDKEIAEMAAKMMVLFEDTYATVEC